MASKSDQTVSSYQTKYESLRKRVDDGEKFIKPQIYESDLIIRFFTDIDFVYLKDMWDF